MTEPKTLTPILEELAAPHSGILYVCSSMDWMSFLNHSPIEVVHLLKEWIGAKGTLVMPSLVRLRNVVEYMETNPVFDVRKTPTATGIIPEVFRRMPETRRSLHPYLSVAALGPQSEYLTEAHHQDVNPCGPESPFRRIVRHPSWLLGLGVTPNTNIFIHVVDEILKQESTLPLPIYYPQQFSGTVIDREGNLVAVSTQVFQSKLLENIQPRTVVESEGPAPEWYRRMTVGRSIFFALDIARYVDLALTLGRSDLKAGRPPRWHAY